MGLVLLITTCRCCGWLIITPIAIVIIVGSVIVIIVVFVVIDMYKIETLHVVMIVDCFVVVVVSKSWLLAGE